MLIFFQQLFLIKKKQLGKEANLLIIFNSIQK